MFVRGCVYFFYQVLVCLPIIIYAIILFRWLGFRPLFVVSLATISLFLNIPVSLAFSYSTTLVDTTYYSLKTFPETGAFCVVYSDIRPTLCLRTTNVGTVFLELTS